MNYQDNAIITLQSGHFIEGQDAPIPTSDHSDHITITHLTGPNLPERILTWQQGNYSFPGEDIVGSMGCYICGQDHFTTEHQSHNQPRQQQQCQPPPPNYLDTICNSSTLCMPLLISLRACRVFRRSPTISTLPLKPRTLPAHLYASETSLSAMAL